MMGCLPSVHEALGSVSLQQCADRIKQDMFINAELGRLRQDDQKFKVILYLIVSSRPV